MSAPTTLHADWRGWWARGSTCAVVPLVPSTHSLAPVSRAVDEMCPVGPGVGERWWRNKVHRICFHLTERIVRTPERAESPPNRHRSRACAYRTLGSRSRRAGSAEGRDRSRRGGRPSTPAAPWALGAVAATAVPVRLLSLHAATFRLTRLSTRADGKQLCRRFRPVTGGA